MLHVLLNAEVVYAEIEVQRCPHADGTQVGGPMGPGSNLVHFRKVRNPAQMRDSSRMHDRGADVIDQLLLYALLAIIDSVENFAHSQGSRGVPANQAEAFLQFRGCGIFQPEQVVRFKFFSQPRRFNRSESMMGIVPEV